MRVSKRLLFLFLVAHCLMAFAPRSQALEVGVVLSQRGGIHAQFAEALTASIAGSGHRVRVVQNLQDGVEAESLSACDLLVTAGNAATEAALSLLDKPTLAALVNTRQLQQLRAQHRPERLSAIVLDQPIDRHLALIRAALPATTRVAMLSGPETRLFEEEFMRAGSLAGFQPQTRRVSSTEELLPALDKLLERSDVLLTLPDPVASSPTTARSILLSSYRLRRPVFAYSRAYVEAGALAAVFSSPEDIARDIGDWLREQPVAPHPVTLPEARGPAYFAIAVNRQVARSLNLTIADDSTLLARLREVAR